VDAAPVIARGHNVAALIPPVPEAALPYLLPIPEHPTLVLAPDAARAVAVACALEAAGRPAAGVVAVSGLARAARRLGSGFPPLLLAAVEDAAALLRRSALKPAEARTIVLAWPDELEPDGIAALETVMSECDKEAQRILLASLPGPALDTLLERFAWKAMTFGFPAVDEPPPLPCGPARFVVAAADRVADVRRRILDAVNPERDDALQVAACPRSREEAERVFAAAPGDSPPIFVAEPHQLPWLRRHFHPLTALRLPSAADAAERRAERIRSALAGIIEAGNLDRELLALSPLFDRYDPADVAAAALRAAQAGRLAMHSGEAATGAADAPVASGIAAWAKIWVGVGKKDSVRAGDLVGAIVGEAKVPGERIGKIDVRDLYTLVEVRAEDAERVAGALTGATIRGRRVVARVDRGSGPPRQRRG